MGLVQAMCKTLTTAHPSIPVNGKARVARISLVSTRIHGNNVLDGDRSLKDEPSKFWPFNAGDTCLADGACRTSRLNAGAPHQTRQPKALLEV